MQYTILGKRTGLKVSALGFGAMRLPMKGPKVDRDLATPMIQRAFEMGVNYIDSAVGYCNSDSQAAVGDALKGWRDKIIVSTKNHSYGKDDYANWRKNLEESLRKLQVEYIDVYHLHGLNWKGFVENVDVKGGSYGWMAKAKDEGLIRHIAFSFHDEPDALAKIARTGMFDVTTCQYNLLDRANEDAIAVCHKEGLGVVVMGPVAGGRLGAPSAALQKLIPESASVPEVAVRFVIANPNVSVALSGMGTMEMVEENCQVSSKAALTSSEKSRVKRVLAQFKKLADLYCTGCNYCMPCPAGVNISENFNLLNQLQVYGLESVAREGYKHMANKASLCLACGKCMPKCPQHIDIINQLRQTVRRLDEAYGQVAVQLSPGSLAKFSRSGAAAKVELRGKVTLANLSDREAETKLSFKPAKGVTVELARNQVSLGAFARKNLPVTIKAAYKPGKAISAALAVESDSKCAIGPSDLNLAIATYGGEKALAKALPVPLLEADKGVRVTEAVSAKHGLKFSLAYDSDALYLKAAVKDDLAHTAERGEPWQYDRLEIMLDLSGLGRPQGSQAPKFQYKIFLTLPTPENQHKLMMDGWGPTEGIVVDAKRAAGGAAITMTLPWKLLGCSGIKGGESFGFNLMHVSHAASGKENYRRHWASQGGWVMLAE